MDDVYIEAKKRIKALENLDRHSPEEVISWVIGAMDTRYPQNRKKAFEIVTKKNWGTIRDEIIQTVTSQNYEEIHKLRDAMLGLDLLFNKDLIRSGLIIDGTLAVISGKNPNIALFTLLSVLNAKAKDSKLETYLLYRYFAGEPKLPNGFFQKF
jgi:hypothetical protein